MAQHEEEKAEADFEMMKALLEQFDDRPEDIQVIFGQARKHAHKSQLGKIHHITLGLQFQAFGTLKKIDFSDHMRFLDTHTHTPTWM